MDDSAVWRLCKLRLHLCSYDGLLKLTNLSTDVSCTDSRDQRRTKCCYRNQSRSLEYRRTVRFCHPQSRDIRVLGGSPTPAQTSGVTPSIVAFTEFQYLSRMYSVQETQCRQQVSLASGILSNYAQQAYSGLFCFGGYSNRVRSCGRQEATSCRGSATWNDQFITVGKFSRGSNTKRLEFPLLDFISSDLFMFVQSSFPLFR